jgi:hypothetical protein
MRNFIVDSYDNRWSRFNRSLFYEALSSSPVFGSLKDSDSGSLFRDTLKEDYKPNTVLNFGTVLDNMLVDNTYVRDQTYAVYSSLLRIVTGINRNEISKFSQRSQYVSDRMVNSINAILQTIDELKTIKSRGGDGLDLTINQIILDLEGTDLYKVFYNEMLNIMFLDGMRITRGQSSSAASTTPPPVAPYEHPNTASSSSASAAAIPPASAAQTSIRRNGYNGPGIEMVTLSKRAGGNRSHRRHIRRRGTKRARRGRRRSSRKN